MGFKDHFSNHARLYEQYRPTYSPALFAYLAGQVPDRGRCWDCGTGNGQAARGLADFFQEVVATDASAEQIEHATGPHNVRFAVAPAEASGLADASVDMVTVAQAFHWFDFEPFFSEVKRVLKPGGILALWGYQLSVVSPEIDARVQRYYDDEVGAFWAPERRLVDEGYASVAFPGKELPVEPQELTAVWSCEQLVGYLRSWSATQKAIRVGKGALFDGLSRDLFALWGSEPRTIRWPLFMRLFIIGA